MFTESDKKRGRMSYQTKIILASNFYGSYLDSKEFDDTIIISDAGIDQ